MPIKEKIYFGISIVCTALGLLGLEGYVNLNKKYNQLDKKFTAVSDTLKDYKTTPHNQGLYEPLRKDLDSLKAEITQLRGFTEAFFDGSEKNNIDFSNKINELEKKTSK